MLLLPPHLSDFLLKNPKALKIITKMRSRKGTPCKKVSNQSMSSMPIAPPLIHLILPQICGSGEKGANPKVTQTKAMNPMFLIKNLIRLFITLNIFNNYHLFSKKKRLESPLKFLSFLASQSYTSIFNFEK